jgi:phosphoadenosine phosphosulfate reductase
LFYNISKPIQLPLLKQDLDAINIHLSLMTPEEILGWALDYLPGLHQTTAFGLTGLVAIDLLSKLTPSPPPLIFLDTLYHFRETYELVEEVKSRYKVPVHVYKPDGCETVVDFEVKYGEKYWEKDDDSYHFVAKVCRPYESLKISLLTHLKQKVEPALRAYKELGVQSVITGRRASQGGDRATLQPLEVDPTGLLKLNPLFSWNFQLVEWYISENQVPRNKLLDQGYRSVGDWHSTSKVSEGQDERAGRWAGQEKTECGLHKDYFVLKAQAKLAAAGVSLLFIGKTSSKSQTAQVDTPVSA